VTATAQRVGIGSPETLRRAFLARTGVPPSVYLQRFRSARRAP
jgi:AraC-like DNA-binding protein